MFDPVRINRSFNRLAKAADRICTLAESIKSPPPLEYQQLREALNDARGTLAAMEQQYSTRKVKRFYATNRGVEC